MAEAQITNRRVEGVLVIDISGRLGMNRSAGAVRETVRQCLADGEKKLLINMTLVTHMDSSGIAELVSGYTMAVGDKASFKMTGVSRRLLNIIEMTGLHRVFEIYDDERAAILSF